MISWNEAAPDARSHPLEDRPGQLPGEFVSLQAASGDGFLADIERDGPFVAWHEACVQNVMTHVGGSRVECGGLLLGKAWHMADNTVCIIDVVDAVIAPSADGTAISLSMGTDLWAAARTRASEISVDGTFNDPVTVGWYHSHPGLGAFFSATDRQTQANFFRESWHLGLVVDPIRTETAWFRGGLSTHVPETRVINGNA